MSKITNQAASGSSTEQAAQIADLQDQVATLEELLQVYEESAIDQEQRLQGMLVTLAERAEQLGHSQETLQTLKSILDSMGDAVIVVDQTGKSLFTNPAAKQLLANESLSASFEDWINHCDIFDSDGQTPLPVEALPLSRALQGDAMDAVEIRIIRHHHQKGTWLSVNARPILASETITGAVAVLRDITARKQFEDDLNQSHKAAQEQAQILEQTLTQLKHTQAKLIHGEKMASLGTTVAGIAHEINNPINFIHGNLKHTSSAFQDLLSLIQLFQKTYPEKNEAIEETLDDIDFEFLAKDVPTMITSMHTGTVRIREIVKSLRVFSRLDEEGLKPANIHEGIESALMIVRSQLTSNQAGIAVEVEQDYGQLPLINCYANQLNQAFVHILKNAIEALSETPASPKIIIRTRTFDTHIVISIIDNGSGIAPAVKPKIFDPFFTTKPVGHGTGLGLSIAYQIISETHKGSLECLSKEGHGSEFSISLPSTLQET
ncbi:MAG: ATP-binding protein [Cyanobacteria bacterium J06621_11]